MNPTDTTAAGMPPPDTQPEPRRRLRRSRANRVGAGVAAGLGEYFGLDPVLFRVLFATSAFFGGAGILAYLLAWAAIPEQGTERAPIDGWVGELRRRRVPLWLVAVVGGLLLWGIAFSWWMPGPFLPVVAVAVVLVVVFGRRELQNTNAGARTADDPATAISLTKTPADTAATTPLGPDGTPTAVQPASGQPTWVAEGRAWLDEARAAHRARRRRASPVKIATLGTLVVALIVLAIVDSAGGIPIHDYFWTSTAILVAGLIVGGVMRRTPWSIAALLPLAVAGNLAFSATSAQFGDGIGDKQWHPTTVPATQYRLAFGRGELDLRDLPEQTAARTVDVRLGAGQVKIIAPPTLNMTVHAHIHIGQLDVRGVSADTGHGGVSFNRTVDPLPEATGAPITVNVRLADGNVTVQR